MEDFEDFLGRDLRLFGVDEEFIDKLKWMDKFVKEEVEPLDTLGFSPYDIKHPVRAALFPPLQREVQRQSKLMFAFVLCNLQSEQIYGHVTSARNLV